MKKLSREEMKHVLGGKNMTTQGCTASITCGNGHTYSCAGNIGQWSDGSTLGCSGEDGINMTCYYQDGGTWHASGVQCRGSKDAEIFFT